jgi:hypothetical protein
MHATHTSATRGSGSFTNQIIATTENRAIPTSVIATTIVMG